MEHSSLKLSSPATHQFWSIPILFEDEHLLAINKPAGVLTSPEPEYPDHPDLITLLHRAIAEHKPWAAERGITHLTNAHRLDYETTGVLLMARSKAFHKELTNLFGSDKVVQNFTALVAGTPEEDSFDVDVPLGPHPRVAGLVAGNPRSGKKSKTHFEVVQKFRGYTLLRCRPLTTRTHQIRVHLRWVQLPVVGDEPYRGRPLLLSELKKGYHLGPGKEERPLISTAAIHLDELTLNHPIAGQPLTIKAEFPKDLTVALKYLKRYAGM